MEVETEKVMSTMRVTVGCFPFQLHSDFPITTSYLFPWEINQSLAGSPF